MWLEVVLTEMAVSVSVAAVVEHSRLRLPMSLTSSSTHCCMIVRMVVVVVVVS